MHRWFVPVSFAALTIAFVLLALRAPAPPVLAEGATARAATPVLSVRRAPDALATFVADTRLAARIEGVLADRSLGEGRTRNCLLVRQGGRVVYQRQPATVLVPASNLKLATAQAALTKLGAETRLETVVLAGAPASGGVIDGNLWIVGAGDPLLATKDYAESFANQPQLRTPYEDLADAVLAAGVREVRGAVVGDESRYDTQRYLPSWRSAYITEGHVGPESALAVNDGFAQFKPRKVAASQPAAHAAAVLTDLLRAKGVLVAGEPSQGKAPGALVRIAAVRSPTIAEVVGEMLRESDNNTAELLTKELGRQGARQGTTAAGVGVLRDTLAGGKLPVEDLRAVDGSGLDRSNGASCRLLTEILADAGPHGPIADGLAVAGETGTLRQRFDNNPAAGRLHAKTGFLDGTVGLSGWMEKTRGGDLLFSFLANGLPLPTEGPAEKVQEALGAALASYPDVPPADQLAPGAR